MEKHLYKLSTTQYIPRLSQIHTGPQWAAASGGFPGDSSGAKPAGYVSEEP